MSISTLQDFENFIEIFPNIYRATFNLQFGPLHWPVSIFLINVEPSNNIWILIDTADPDNISKFFTALTQHFLKFPNYQLKYILLTHDHFDHTGSILRLLDEYKDIKLVLGEPESFHTNNKNVNGNTHTQQLATVEGKITVDKNRIVMIKREKEEEFEFFNVLKPIFIADHTLEFVSNNIGSISYLHIPTNCIMVGDSLMNLSTSQCSEPVISLPFTSTPSHLNSVKESIKNIARLDVKIVFPAHDHSQKGLSINDVRAFANTLKT
ncbi:24945_t:CDS:2 [Dentiscutata erythropus]|uniref:24945_t:CDS:1 n=1 Tax=Dentiscutata erythropus TaxID=1348616 RepID=A0A9N8ZVT3_9GLOM|nr:24945_t:CDS:2 [Dentiscutata erythropus]